MLRQYLVSPRVWLWLLVIYQFFSVALMAVGVWPPQLAWLNLLLGAAYAVLAPASQALLFLALSVPFYVALPNPYSDSLSVWRVWFLLLFLAWVLKGVSRQGLKAFYRAALKNFRSYDAYFAGFLLLALLSAFSASYPWQSLKQLAFLLNAYLVYVVAVNALTSRSEALRLLKYAAASLVFMVLLGYLQLLITFFVSYDSFWKYWAVRVATLYYGASLGNVLLYSNSWFAYAGGRIESLRMFGPMPDSHSFAMVAAFAIIYLLPLSELAGRWKSYAGRARWLLRRFGYWVWSAIRMSGLAIAFSGTRGMWVGMLPPLVLSLFGYFRPPWRRFSARVFWALALIILFFALSPFINYGLNYLKVSRFEENFLERAKSSYDLTEESNQNRLLIWRESLSYALAHPLGTGYGNFIVSLVPQQDLSLGYKQLSQIKNLRYNLPEKFVTAHSLYLNVLVETGFAGLLIFCLYFAEILRRLLIFMKGRAGQGGELNLFVFALWFGLIWFLAYGVFDVALFNDRILIYLFISLGLASYIMKTPAVPATKV